MATIVATALVAAAVSGVAIGFIDQSEAVGEEAEPVVYAPLSAKAASIVEPEVALADALSSIGGDAVTAATIGAPPPDVARLDKTRASLPWFYATVRVPALRDGIDIRPMWEADLIEGVVAERSGAGENVRTDFGGATFAVVLPDGKKIEDASGGLGDVATRQTFSAASSASVKASLTEAVAAAGLTLISVEILRPLGPAPAVVASVDDREIGKVMADLVPLSKQLFGDPPAFEGHYLEIQNSGGTALVRNSTSFRTGAGRFWVDPAWADRAGIKSLGRAAPAGSN